MFATVHNYPPDSLINNSSAPLRSLEMERFRHPFRRILCRQNSDFTCRKEALVVPTGCFLTPCLLFIKTDSIMKKQFEFRHIFNSVHVCVCVRMGRELLQENSFFHHNFIHHHCFFPPPAHTDTHTENNPPQLTLTGPVNASLTCKHCC